MDLLRRHMVTLFLSLVSACVAIVGYGFTTGQRAGAYENRLAQLERQQMVLQAEQEKLREAVVRRLDDINTNLVELRAEERILHRAQLGR